MTTRRRWSTFDLAILLIWIVYVVATIALFE